MAIPSKKWVVCFLSDVDRLGHSLWLEVLAVNSHGGSSPPLRTEKPLEFPGVFLFWATDFLLALALVTGLVTLQGLVRWCGRGCQGLHRLLVLLLLC